ncbi:MAG: septum formation protein Maf [FCB group bacterium]|nr:septum formation protein Maf [FCB group bacterium]
MTDHPLILASGSPRRTALLKQIDLEFQVIPSTIEEDFSISLPPKEFAEHYAREKAYSVAREYPGRLVVGADTIVVVEDKILGKPANEQESFEMLSLLSGRSHRVITGVSLQWLAKRIDNTFSVTTEVIFRTISSEEIWYYIQNYAPFDKAGSYGIQDWFSVCVKEIHGCFYNVVGFPLSEFYQRYKKIMKR